ncbi:uncharacterized protein EI97DRAFT_465891 [Westerdykella ornata]|uniref:Asl1-like glycosyl hydrolase catalytic domain-containing protein n=1 Tax=Westerdykella ornata TaxID=318751 RepID=A0A6A6JME5_WESOR|nr:uncharacterized protein EI97DRAFT_465891 [Westerdykella ornata]KAF2277761.1 hypothetical protein EI97DRAFT_465891 [Westerdykella ornata]
MVVKKRCLLWDWTNTKECPGQMDKVHFGGPIASVSNWNAWVPPELKGRAPFRPMIHLERELNGNEWQWIKDSHESIIHFFNEPERNGISPEKAADYWRKQVIPELRNKRGKKLVSPSCASDDGGKNWLYRWMELVKDCPPDFLGMHWYGTDPNLAIRDIEAMHKRFPKLRIIVSEIASISRDSHQVFEFTKKVCNWMDGTDYIFEYAFFGCMKKMPDQYVSEAARLMKPDGSFTDLMNKYMHEQPMK